MSRSFLRCWDGTAFLFRPLSHRPDESATSYSLASCTPALLASASPADFILNSGPEFNQPPPSGGWGIFDRLYGDFSSGLDMRHHAAHLFSPYYRGGSTGSGST
jgi:hypothetical protein